MGKSEAESGRISDKKRWCVPMELWEKVLWWKLVHKAPNLHGA